MTGGLLEKARAVQHRAALGIVRPRTPAAPPAPCDIAPAHMAQGSSDTNSVVPPSRSLPSFAAAARITSISAWAVGSFRSRMRLPSWAKSAPSADSSTAPTGTSPRGAAAFASASASAMASRHRSWRSSVGRRHKPEGERIAKVIARAGICSRRDAEKLIAEGRVMLDGEIVTTPAINVTENNVDPGGRQAAGRARSRRGCGAITSRPAWSPPTRTRKAAPPSSPACPSAGPGGLGGAAGFQFRRPAAAHQ